MGWFQHENQRDCFGDHVDTRFEVDVRENISLWKQ